MTEPVVPPVCTTLDAGLTAITEGPFATLSRGDEGRLDTARIQSAIDRCGKGRAVALRLRGKADAFVSGPLVLREGVTLLVNRGTTLFVSIDPTLFENAPGSCGIVNARPGPGCKPFISVPNVAGAAIMGEGVIDGRGGIKLLGRDASAWEIAQRSGPGGKRLSRLIIADHADDFTLYGITLRNAPNFNVSYRGGNGFTAWGVKIDTPQRVGKAANPLARNTDGIDPGGGARNVTITRSFIRVGDDNIALKGGPGGVSNVTISHNHFYWGHGMSIGSETEGGVSKIRVSDLTLDGTDAGLRIKSAGDRGGLVQDVVYEDICIRNVARPIDIAASYKANKAATGNSPPVYRDITLRNVGISGGGQIIVSGYDDRHHAQVTLDGVYRADAATRAYTYDFARSDITIGPRGSDIPAPGASAVASPASAAKSCSGRFVPFPVAG